MNYYKFIPLNRKYTNEETARDCMNLATVMLEKYPHLKIYQRVCFSDEVHFSYTIKDKLRIIQKVSICYCQNCIEEVNDST